MFPSLGIGSDQVRWERVGRSRAGELLTVLLLVGCRDAIERDEPADPPAAPASARDIPASALAGNLRGQPFALARARYTVDHRPGYEKVELRLFGAGADSPSACDPVPTGTPSVWLRRPGPEPIARGQWRTSVGADGPWEVHYQVLEGGRWVGVGESNALIVVDRVGPDSKVEGELAACFRDARGSCVKGRFTATYCRIEIDAPVRGADVMERAPESPVPQEGPTVPPRGAPSGVQIVVDPRAGLLPTYPCSRCHAGREPNPNRRELRQFHVVRNSDFSHGDDEFWCYQCHARDDIDQLRTATGRLLSFNEAFRICLSCHGDKQDAWENGTHGLILGNWNGAQRKKSCPACHDPHHPAFPKMEPLAPPALAKGAPRG